LLKISDPLTVSVIAAAGALSTVIDLRVRRIPNALTGAIAVAGLVAAAAARGPVTPLQAMAGFAIGLVIMLPGHAIGATGAGDVKLFAAIGTWLGPQATLLAFLYTALAGGALAVLVSLRRRILHDTLARAATLVSSGGSNVGDIETSRVNRFAYAPAIAIGTLVAALGF
jgi:prepilin peptidase CpaA